MIKALHPKNILTLLDQLDRVAPSHTLSREASLRRVMVVLACVCVCLLLVHYVKYSRNFFELLRWAGGLSGTPNVYVLALRDAGFLELAGYAWWSAIHLVGYVIIPALVIRWVLRERVVDMGWRWNETAQHWRSYLLLTTPILFFVYLVSLGDDFVNHYPFYDQASRSWLDLLCWWALYIGQFVFLEFFFRGFMLNALRPALGANAIWIMCVPYLMIHFPKLWLEATGAILFGLFLGILALASRSIWGGVMVHITIALAMDTAALLRKGGLPSDFLPF